jgi:pyruvate kinase
MAEVATAAETWPRPPERLRQPSGAADTDRVAWAVAHAAVQAAEDLGVAAIVCPTRSGQTARRVAAFRPSMPIAGISAAPDVLAGLSLVWGVTPVAEIVQTDGDAHLQAAIDAALAAGIVESGDLVALVFGAAGPRAGSTDSVRVVRA